MTTSGRSGSAQPWMIVLPTEQQRESWIQIIVLLMANAKCICTLSKMYFSKWKNVFVQMAKCICTLGKMYFSKCTAMDCLPIKQERQPWIQGFGV